MKKLFNMLLMMNLIEVKILGFVSHAGGNNARLNKLLCNGKEIGNRYGWKMKTLYSRSFYI